MRDFIDSEVTSNYLPFIVIAALEPYYFAPNMLQTLEIKALKVAKWTIAWKK